jgi:hypothetical protein
MTDSESWVPSRNKTRAVGCQARDRICIRAGAVQTASVLPETMFHSTTRAEPFSERIKIATLAPAGETSESPTLSPDAKVNCRVSVGEGTTWTSGKLNRDDCCWALARGAIVTQLPMNIRPQRMNHLVFVRKRQDSGRRKGFVPIGSGYYIATWRVSLEMGLQLFNGGSLYSEGSIFFWLIGVPYKQRRINSG